MSLTPTGSPRPRCSCSRTHRARWPFQLVLEGPDRVERFEEELLLPLELLAEIQDFRQLRSRNLQPVGTDVLEEDHELLKPPLVVGGVGDVELFFRPRRERSLPDDVRRRPHLSESTMTKKSERSTSLLMSC